MIIADNMLANGAARQLKIIGNNKKKPTERLSSGYRINRASDDAAGLSISEKMRGQIRGLTRASQNVQDGISLIQTGEGALDEVHSMLQRIRELAVEASNDTYTDDDREAIGKEVENIKDEMTRVFNEAEFNTIQIFRARYVPDIKTVPNDYELYNLSDGTPAAGVLINHKRYSWDELGAPKTSENNGWEKKFYDDNGELIWLRLEAGKDPSEMHRVYFLEADDRGIKINNLYAGEWDSTIEQNGLTYSFSFHGMDISIETRLGDSREDIISQLNPDGLSFNSWDAIPISGGRYSAVNVSGDTMTLNVTNNNKYEIADWSYHLDADEDGVALVQTNGDDGLNHSKTKWNNFTNTNTGESFPISDWGIETEGTNPVTLASLSQGASYNYTDSANAGYLVDKLSIDFNFPLDETSKQQVMDGLTSDITGYDVQSPIKTAYLSDNKVTLTDYTGFSSFEFQRDELVRNFGENGSDSNMNLTISRTLERMNRYTYTTLDWSNHTQTAHYAYSYRYVYSVTNSSGTEIMKGNSEEFFKTNDPDSPDYHDIVYNEFVQLNNGTYAIGMRFYKSLPTENNDRLRNVTLYDANGHNASISLRYDKGVYDSTLNMTIMPDGKAKRSFSSPEKSVGTATNTALTVIVNPTEKILHFQAGANAGQSIDLTLPGLSNSIIGIGGARFDSSKTAQATISMTDIAIEKISDVRALFGAYQNRLEHAHSIDLNTAENLQNAESRIKDADMAKEAVELAKQSILEQVGQSMITQANQNTQGILKLLQ